MKKRKSILTSEEVKRKIAQAKSVYEIGRILKQARLDQE